MTKNVAKLLAVTVLITLLLVSPIYASFFIIKKSPTQNHVLGVHFLGIGTNKTSPTTSKVIDSGPTPPVVTGSAYPVITLYSPPNNYKTKETTNIHNFSVSDPDDATVGCSLWYNGSQKWSNLSVNADGRYNGVPITETTEGTYRWKIRCIDSNSNLVYSQTRTLTIDTTPPHVVYNLGEQSVGTNWIYWTWNNPTDSDFDHTEIWINGVFKENTTNEYFNATGLQPSTSYQIKTVTVDDVGNRGTGLVDWAQTSDDTVAPVINFNPNTDLNGTYKKDWIFINATVIEDNPQTVNLIWNGASETFDNNNGNVYWENKTGLSSGTYTFKVYVQDTSGNTGYSEERKVILDTTAPAGVSDLNETAIGETWIYWQWTNPSDADFDHVEVWLNGTFQENTTNEYFNATGLNPDTLYEIEIRSVDTAGNIGSFVNDTARTLTVDTLPTFDFVRINPSSPRTDDDLNCEFQYQDAENLTLPADITWYKNNIRDNEWDTTVTAQNNTLMSSNGPTASDTTAGETWTCEVTLHDRDGDVAQNSSSVTISGIPNTAPGVYITTPNNTYTRNTSPTIDYYFIDNENETGNATLYFDGNSVATEFNVQNNTPSTITPTSAQSEGTHTYYIEVYDGKDTGVSATQTITIDITAPNINYITYTDANGTYAKNWISVNVSATDANLDSVTLEWNGVNESFAQNAGDAYWTNKTGLASGTYTFRAWAEDLAENKVSTPLRTITLDNSYPGSISNLRETAVGTTWIYWQWTNPSDADFDHTEIWINGTHVADTSNPYYNATGLNPNTLYEIGTHTVDNVGNVNPNWVNDTARTLKVNHPPFFGWVNVTPDSPLSNQNLGCSFLADDNENNDFYANVTWYRDGSHLTNWDSTNIAVNNNTATNAPNAPSAADTQAGETWTCEVTVWDASGSNAMNGSETIQNVPNTKPGVYLVSPDNNSITNDNTPTHQFYFIDNENQTTSCTLYYNSSPLATNSTTFNNTVTDLTVPSSVLDGVYNWYVTCDDGISTAQSDVRTITVDTVAPSLYYNSNTDSNGTYSKDWVFINVTADDNVQLDSVVLEWNGVNETFDNHAGTLYWENKTGLAEGTYTFKVYANDTAGSVVSTGERAVTLDRTPPVTVSNLDETARGTTWIYWQWTNPSDADFDHTEIWINGTHVADTSNPYYNATGLNPNTLYEIGTHTVDNVGNVNTFWINDTARTLKSQNHVPTLNLVDVIPDNPTSSDNLGCNFRFTDNENSTLLANVTWYRNGIHLTNWDQTNLAVTNNTLESTPTAPAYTDTSTGETWTCEVTVWDSAGASAMNGSETIQSSTPNTLPTIYITTRNSTIVSTSTPTIQFYFTDPEDARGQTTLYFNGTVVGTNSSVLNNTLTSITTSSLPDGLYWFWVTVNDGAGTNASLNYTMRIDTAGAFANLYFNPNTDQSGAYSKDWIFINVTAKDPQYTNIVLEWNGVNETFDNHAGTLYWENKTGLAEGTYTFKVYANNTTSVVDVTELRTVTLDRTPPPTVVTSPWSLNETAVGETWILWNWTNPSTDFDHVQIWINGTHVNDTSNNYFNATGLQPNTTYEIGLLTVDAAGNVNTTWVNDTAKTLAQTSNNGGGGGHNYFGGGAAPKPKVKAILTITPNNTKKPSKQITAGVGLSSEESLVKVVEGKVKMVPITIENTGNVEDVYVLKIDGPGWASVDGYYISLKAGDSKTVNLVLSPAIGDVGNYTVRVVANSQNYRTESTWDLSVMVVPAGGIIGGLITFAGGRTGASLLGLAFLFLLSAIFVRTGQMKKIRAVASRSKKTEEKVKEEEEFLNHVIKRVEEIKQSGPTAVNQEVKEVAKEFDFTPRKDKYIWEV